MVSGPHHPIAAIESVGLKNLNEQTVLLPTQDCAYKMTFERMMTEEKISYSSVMELNSIEAIKQYVAEGIGIAVLPEYTVKKEITGKKLIRLSWDEGELETAVLMIRHKDKWISPQLQAFMDLVHENFTH